MVIKSFVRRNSRTSQGHKQVLSRSAFLCSLEMLSTLPSKSNFVGLEIGFGMGDSLIDVAEKNPQQLWLGVEVYLPGVASVLRQAEQNNLTNIYVGVGDVTELLTLLQADSCDHIRLFFPDPWPKKRHNKRRLMTKESLTLMARVLKKGGQLHIATDNGHYAEQCQILIEENLQMSLSKNIPFRPETKFAKKAKQAGQIISDILAVRL